MWRSRLVRVQSSSMAAAAATAAAAVGGATDAAATTATASATTASVVAPQTTSAAAPAATQSALDVSAPADASSTRRVYGPRPRLPWWPLLRPRVGCTRPTTYISRTMLGHVDTVALLVHASRPDAEWVWVRALCFFCASATIGTWLYGLYFNEKVKYFKDEPWSPFRN